jgi:acetyl-CoA synthetase
MILFVVASSLPNNYDKDIRQIITEKVGKFALPDNIFLCQSIPKTNTGKVIRRVLRSILENKSPGDLSTCINIESIDHIKSVISS